MPSACRRGSRVIFGLDEGHRPAASQHLCITHSLGWVPFGCWDVAFGVWDGSAQQKPLPAGCSGGPPDNLIDCDLPEARQRLLNTHFLKSVGLCWDAVTYIKAASIKVRNQRRWKSKQRWRDSVHIFYCVNGQAKSRTHFPSLLALHPGWVFDLDLAAVALEQKNSF